MKKKILLLTVAMLSTTTAYSMCYPTIGTKENPCLCQFPVFDGKELTCGDDYCEKVGKKCMNDGSCCDANKICGSLCCENGQICSNNQCINLDCSLTHFAGKKCNAGDTSETCQKLETDCNACGWDWTAYWTDRSGNGGQYVCAGDIYCKQRFGGGTWGLAWDAMREDIKEYGCVGNEFCQIYNNNPNAEWIGPENTATGEGRCAKYVVVCPDGITGGDGYCGSDAHEEENGYSFLSSHGTFQ